MKKELATGVFVLCLSVVPAHACGGGGGGGTELAKFTNKRLIEAMTELTRTTAGKFAGTVVGPLLNLLDSGVDAAEVMGPQGVRGYKTYMQHVTDDSGTPLGTVPNSQGVMTKGMFTGRNAQATIEYWSK